MRTKNRWNAKPMNVKFMKVTFVRLVQRFKAHRQKI